MKNYTFGIRILLSICLVATASADERKPLKSGLQRGETVASFQVEDVTGPAKGTSICYACRYGNRPVVNVFARSMTDEVVMLIRELDAQVAKHQNAQLQAFFVLLSLDPESDREALEALAAKHGLKHVPLTVFDGLTGPPKMKIAQRADVTVMLWNEAKVVSNHTFTAASLKAESVKAVIQDVPKLLE